MKSFYFMLLFAVAFVSCSKDKTAAAPQGTVSGGTVKLAGLFYPTAGIAVNGTVTIYSDGSRFLLSLENFQVSSGPDLKVYLSKKDTPFEYVNLGPLQSNSGNQLYNVPKDVDLSVYKYALIHCQQYNHLFAVAALKP